MNFLYLAYGAVWTIHAIYLWTLIMRYSHLRKDIEELKK